MHSNTTPLDYISLGERVSSLPLGAPDADKQEDVFAVILDAVDLIYVGCVGLAKPALHDITRLIPGAVDRIVALVTEELVRAGIAVYAVVAIPANHRVVASAGVEQVGAR